MFAGEYDLSFSVNAVRVHVRNTFSAIDRWRFCCFNYAINTRVLFKTLRKLAYAAFYDDKINFNYYG